MYIFSPVALKDEATFQYRVELGAILVTVVIICLLVSFCIVMKKRMREGGNPEKEDLKNILVDTPEKEARRVGVSMKSSFQYIDYRKPAGRVVENLV